MNNNITEDYCSFEVSKLLKKKGFDIECQYSYDYEGNNFCSTDDNSTIKPSKLLYGYCSPTHSLAIKWIRENFDISIDVASYYNPDKKDKRMYEVGISGKHNGYEGLMWNASQRIGVDWTENPSKYWLFDSPEEATEAALLYTLKNLI